MKVKFGVSLKIEFLIVVFLFIIFTAGTLAVFFIRTQRSILQGSVETKTEIIAKRIANLSNCNVLSKRLLKVQKLVEKIVNTNDIVCISVYDANAVKLLESKVASNKLEDFLSFREKDIKNIMDTKKLNDSFSVYKTKEFSNFFEFIVPMVSYDETNEIIDISLFSDNMDNVFFAKEGIIGFVRVIVSLENVNKEVSRISYIVCILTIIVVLGSAALSLICIKFFLLNPINELILGTKRIEEGDLSYKVPMFSVIEFRFLSESFNKMVQKLKHNVDLLVKEKNNLLKTKNLLEVKSKELQSSLVKMQNMREELIKEESYAIIGRLVSTVAHELNNSLAGIDNIAYYLINMNDLRDEKSQKMIRLMLDSVRRISVVVSNLIIFSKRCGKKIYRTDTYVDEIVNQSIESVKLPRNIKIHKEMEHFKAFIDPVKMIQIMRTFILNSIDAISNDYGNIEISIKRIADMVEIKIKDNGCGISKENTKYMFEPFFTTKLKGVGLDLCIAKDIIAAHKGTITINSLENIGTNISVVFPISNIK